MTAYRFKSWAETSVGGPIFRQDAIALLAGYPGVGDVRASTFFGISGTEYEGTMVGGDVTPVGPEWVVVGHDNFVGGLPGTYPATATSKQEQYEADQALVLAQAGSIKDDAAILGIDGTYDFAAAIAAGLAVGYSAGHAAGLTDQLAADVIIVQANVGYILNTCIILGIRGALPPYSPGIVTRGPNRMAEAVAKLAVDFAAGASIVVTYLQGSKTVTGLSATVGRTPFEVQEGESWTAYESRDYIVQAASLVYQGVPITPASGDRIVEANGKVYEVAVPKPLNVYESIGPTGAVLKIHTKGPF